MAKRYTIRKYMGDDEYSWALFEKRDSRPVLTGMSRSSARYERDKREKEHERIKNT